MNPRTAPWAPTIRNELDGRTMEQLNESVIASAMVVLYGLEVLHMDDLAYGGLSLTGVYITIEPNGKLCFTLTTKELTYE